MNIIKQGETETISNLKWKRFRLLIDINGNATIKYRDNYRYNTVAIYNDKEKALQIMEQIKLLNTSGLDLKNIIFIFPEN